MGMTDAAKISGDDEVPSRRQLFLNCWLMMALGALLCGAAFQNYRDLQEYGFMRTNCMVAAVAAGIGIAFAFGGAMHYADLLLAHDAARRPHFLLRVLLVIQKRLLLILQLAAAALVLGALAAVMFDMNISGPDYSMLSRGGYVPQPSPLQQPL